MSLLALGGEVEVFNGTDSRWSPLSDTFLGPGESAIDHHSEFITHIRFPATGPREGSAFFRVMRPQGVALPIISMACRIRLREDGLIDSARIAVGPAGPVPHLAMAAMDLLAGKSPGAETFEQAASVVLDGASLRDSKYRASREYRAAMILTHLPRVLATATERAVSGKAVPEGVGQ
jgi:carbon-monoxide dehydrogenase medium subunit